MMTAVRDRRFAVATPMPADLAVLHRDTQLLAVHKPAGLLVHRSALDAHADDDVVTRLRAQLGAPVWPVHRLDKGTSGVLLLALDVDSARRLGAQFAATAGAAVDADKPDKRYLALVRGWPAAEGEIDQPLARDPELPSAGQPRLAACTRWQVLQRLQWPIATDGRHADTRLALVSVQPLTGRRHQIRRHFKALAHPLIGDATHGKGPLNRAVAAHLGLQRLWLHALSLTLPHPASGQALTLRAEPGPEWAWLRSGGERPG
jgi:tRNA pseudouridine65 synthase